MRIKEYSLPTGQILHYIGPDMSWGVLPTIFYFSLSGKNSLNLDPFNQPVVLWNNLPLRVCSLDLPNHSDQEDPTQALSAWAASFLSGKNPIQEFLDTTLSCLAHLRKEELINEQLGFAGLSRGAFFASHLAASFEVPHVLGFAPLTCLRVTKEFALEPSLHATIDAFDLKHLAKKLYKKNIRFYIGNQDTRVGTRLCFECLEAFCIEAAEENLRSPSIEMLMLPSIGHQGHGTAPTTFTDGAIWLAKKLGIPDAAFEP